MIQNKIGFYYATTFKEIADYFETLKNYEKVDQVYRLGIESLYEKGQNVDESYFKQHKNLSHQYIQFESRVSMERNLKLKPILLNNEFFYSNLSIQKRSEAESKQIRQENRQFLRQYVSNQTLD